MIDNAELNRRVREATVATEPHQGRQGDRMNQKVKITLIGLVLFGVGALIGALVTNFNTPRYPARIVADTEKTNRTLDVIAQRIDSLTSQQSQLIRAVGVLAEPVLATETTEPSSNRYRVVKYYANIRKEPSTDADILATLNDNGELADHVIAIPSNEDWYRVQIPGGGFGYMGKSLLEAIE